MERVRWEKGERVDGGALRRGRAKLRASCRDGLSLPLLLERAVFPMRLALARGALALRLLLAGPKCCGELLGAGERLLLSAARDAHLGVLVDLKAILGFEEGRHNEFLSAEGPLSLGG